MDLIQAEWKLCLPSWPPLCIIEANSIDSGLPHWRSRVFLYAEAPGMSSFLGPPSWSIRKVPSPSIAKFLPVANSYTASPNTQQCSNLAFWLNAFKSHTSALSAIGQQSTAGVVDVNRDPVNGIYNISMRINCCPPLLTSSTNMIVFRREGGIVLPSLLSIQDKCKLCGINFYTFGLGGSWAHRAIGESIPIPMAGLALEAIFHRWSRFVCLRDGVPLPFHLTTICIDDSPEEPPVSFTTLSNVRARLHQNNGFL
jgi:hypothetical protein